MLPADVSAPPVSASPPAPLRATLQPLDPHVRTVWRIGAGLWWGLLVLAAAAWDVVSLFREGLLPPFVPTAAVLVLAVLYLWLVPRLKYGAWGYALHDTELHVRHGLFNRVATVVPLVRLQHLDVTQNILEKEFDLAKLIVHTAGTRHSTVTVPGLPHATAEALRDTMKAYVRDDAL